MKIQAGIYMIKNLINNKVYIGLTKKENFNIRWNDHIKNLRNKMHGNIHLQNAWNKYGESNFEFIQLEKGLYEDGEIGEREKYWINYYQSNNQDYGYNKTSGGESGFILNDEIKSKISKTQIGKKLSKEHKNKISKSLINRNLSEENKKKIGDANRGRIFSEEIRKKMGEKNKGKKFSQDILQKRSLSQMKLTKEQVLEIYNKIHNGEKRKILSKQYNIIEDIITKIKYKRGIYGYIIDNYNFL